jgi:hypothetical protein
VIDTLALDNLALVCIGTAEVQYGHGSGISILRAVSGTDKAKT